MCRAMTTVNFVRRSNLLLVDAADKPSNLRLIYLPSYLPRIRFGAGRALPESESRKTIFCWIPAFAGMTGNGASQRSLKRSYLLNSCDKSPRAQSALPPLQRGGGGISAMTGIFIAHFILRSKEAYQVLCQWQEVFT